METKSEQSTENHEKTHRKNPSGKTGETPKGENPRSGNPGSENPTQKGLDNTTTKQKRDIKEIKKKSRLTDAALRHFRALIYYRSTYLGKKISRNPVKSVKENTSPVIGCFTRFRRKSGWNSRRTSENERRKTNVPNTLKPRRKRNYVQKMTVHKKISEEKIRMFIFAQRKPRKITYETNFRASAGISAFQNFRPEFSASQQISTSSTSAKHARGNFYDTALKFPRHVFPTQFPRHVRVTFPPLCRPFSGFRDQREFSSFECY